MRGYGDVISLYWMDDNYLVDRPGQYTRTEAEKLHGLQILKARLTEIAVRLGEV